MGFRLNSLAAVAGILLFASFLFSVKILYTNDLENYPGYHMFPDEIQHLKAQLASQAEQRAVLQHQLEQLHSAVYVTGKQTAYANGFDQALPSSPSPDAASSQQHKLAVLVPYRDRQEHLAQLVLRLQDFLTVQGRNFTIFVLEQSPELLFNRGALLNVGYQILQRSDYDHFAFQDVDTLPTAKGKIQYSYPIGKAPLHLTPFRFHPAANFEDFFGGISIFTREQFERVNGYGMNFWGWGREDDNMRYRLVQHDMFPPQVPDVLRRHKRFYFDHQKHEKALEWRVKGQGADAEYYGVNPDVPYGAAKIVSVQPHLMQDMSTGLNTSRYRITNVQAYGPAVQFTIRLHCDELSTPWCSKAST